MGVKPIRAVERAIAVLESFGDGLPSMRLADLAGKLGLNKATLLRLLLTLESRELVRRHPGDRSYMLGPAVIRLGALALGQSQLIEISRPHLKRLQALTGETVCLFIPSSTQRLCVAVIPSQHELRMTTEVGVTRPLYAGAAGKVLLAFMRDEEVRRILGGRQLPRLAKNTVVDRAALGRQLEAIRRAGVAISWEEAVSGAAAVAAPVVDRDETLVAAVNVLGPTVRLTPQRLEELVPAVGDAARRISRELGAPPGSSRSSLGKVTSRVL